MKTLVATSLFLFSNNLLAAPPSYELSCRAQAKEIAAQTYKTCLTDNRNAELEQIKKDYQAKLNALKDQYQADLKRMTKAKTAATKPTESQEATPAVTPAKPKPELPDESEMDIPEPIPADQSV